MADESPKLERPAELLAGIAAQAFEAFNAMQTTKLRHYALLARLDDKNTRYSLPPSADEAALLAALLADHDAQVSRFTAAAGELKRRDAQAHIALFGYISALADVQGDEAGSVRH